LFHLLASGGEWDTEAAEADLAPLGGHATHPRPISTGGSCRVAAPRRLGTVPATVFFNPSCSKCRTVQGILGERGVEADYVRYLEQAPTRADLEALLAKLGTDDPRVVIRRAEPVYDQLGLATASRHELLDALVAHPILIERPIVVIGDRAVVARPAERVLELLDG